ncbi:efflux RND transporter periplasmic adaptor subunit [Rugamonas sp.]|uniref:efflux RND transporter periplasmic adaptor subunit n=1 Tax=Rugamonas sp. TaxID=1926287 RepID=UPI0025E451BA|nr:efflux RND transporter periplasmic adaptor subunit [Rugamonas sp.]
MDSHATPAALTSPPPQQSKRKKIVRNLIAIAVMAALGGFAWHLTHRSDEAAGGKGGPGGAGGRRGGPGGPGGEVASTVGVAAAEKADVPVVLDALGTVTAAATATVRAQVSGILQKVLFTEGQMVKAGQVLAQIDPRQFEMALLQATGQRQRDEAQRDIAKLTLTRYQTLLTQDSIARQDVDTQAALVKQLDGTVKTDLAAEGAARLNLGYTKVIAPISGRVGLRVVDIGNLVGSGDANGLAVITELSPIDVEFSIPQDNVPEVQQRAIAGAALPAIALDRTRVNTLDSGRFAALDNQVDTQTGTVKAKARFANTKFALFPSQFVNVRLQLRTIKDAVMVPVTALRHGSNGDFVYVLKADKTVSLRPVTRGQATVDKIQIVTGLQVGEQVITEGADRLKDGAKVILPGDKPRGAGGKGGKGRGAADAPAAASAATAANATNATNAATAADATAAAKSAAAAAAAASDAASSDAAAHHHHRRDASAAASAPAQ